MNTWRIGIVFCGGCNPCIDRGRIAAQLRADFLLMGYEVQYNSLNVDFIIYLSGCMVNCAVKYNRHDCSSVVVAAATLDAVAVDATRLVTEIVMKVRNYFEKLEGTLSR